MMRTLLVTGGSGRLARQVIDHLLAHGRDRVVTTTRTPGRLDDLAARGVEVRAMSFDDHPDGIARALAGVDRMLMVSTHDIGRRARQHAAVAAAAARAGVGHLLYTSCASPSPDPASEVVSDHFWSELAIMTGPVPWTILRHNMYLEHVFLLLPTAVRDGALRSSMEDGGRAYIARADCAAADAAALLGDRNDRRIYDIGGEEAVTNDALADLAGRLTGRPIIHQRISDAQSLADLAASGLPPGFPESSVGFDICARRGYHAIVTPHARDLAGRAPERTEAFLWRHLEVLRAGIPRHDL